MTTDNIVVAAAIDEMRIRLMLVTPNKKLRICIRSTESQRIKSDGIAHRSHEFQD